MQVIWGTLGQLVSQLSSFPRLFWKLGQACLQLNDLAVTAVRPTAAVWCPVPGLLHQLFSGQAIKGWHFSCTSAQALLTDSCFGRSQLPCLGPERLDFGSIADWPTTSTDLSHIRETEAESSISVLNVQTPKKMEVLLSSCSQMYTTRKEVFRKHKKHNEKLTQVWMPCRFKSFFFLFAKSRFAAAASQSPSRLVPVAQGRDEPVKLSMWQPQM